MKPIAQQLAALIVLLLNQLWTKAQEKVAAADQNIRNWAELTFVKNTDLTNKVHTIGDVRYTKKGDPINANTLNGQSSTQIKSDAYQEASALVKSVKEALRGRATDFALIRLVDGASYDFQDLVTEKLGAPDDLDNGPYEFRFVGGGAAIADLVNITDPTDPTNQKAYTNQSVTNGDTLQFTIVDGVVTKLEFFNDTDAQTFAEHGVRITDLEAVTVATDQTVAGMGIQVNTNEQTLNALVNAAITQQDFAGMKAYIEANVIF